MTLLVPIFITLAYAWKMISIFSNLPGKKLRAENAQMLSNRYKWRRWRLFERTVEHVLAGSRNNSWVWWMTSSSSTEAAEETSHKRCLSLPVITCRFCEKSRSANSFWHRRPDSEQKYLHAEWHFLSFVLHRCDSFCVLRRHDWTRSETACRSEW